MQLFVENVFLSPPFEKGDTGGFIICLDTVHLLRSCAKYLRACGRYGEITEGAESENHFPPPFKA